MNSMKLKVLGAVAVLLFAGAVEAKTVSSDQSSGVTSSPSVTTTDKTGIGKPSPVQYKPIDVVPIPAAVWLLGSGLVGLVGLSRRRK